MIHRGISLILVIILILVISIAILGIAVFILQGARLATLKINDESAIFLAQAGIYSAIRGFEESRSSSLGWAHEIITAPNQSYKYGRLPNYLLVDASWCYFIDYMVLKNIPLENISGYRDIAITEMTVEWDDKGGAMLERIFLGGRPQDASGLPARSGDTIALTPPFQIPNRASYDDVDDNQWHFNGAVEPDADNTYRAPLAITFTLSDGKKSYKRKAIIIDKDFHTGNNEFTITSTGILGVGDDAWKRTTEATYDVGKTPRVITSWQETAEHID